MNKKILKRLITALMFMSDMAMTSWVYFAVKKMSFTNFMPSFQTELQFILLKSFYFLAILFLLTQLLCYLAAMRQMRAAYLYLKIYAVMAFTVSLLIALKYQSFALLPVIIYLGGYYQYAKLFKETAAISSKGNF